MSGGKAMKKKIRTILALMLLLICVGAVGFFSAKYSTSLFNQPDSKNIKKVLATSEENSKESSNEASSESSQEPENPVVPDTQGAEMMANLDVPNDGSQYPELTQEIEKALNKDTFIGSVLVVKDGKVMLNKGYGFADKSQNIGNSFQSLFYIGSVQKSVTAVGIMKLVDEGKLKVDDPVSNFYPNLKGGTGITVRQLLTHMSGIQGRKKPTVAMTHQQVVEDIVNQTVLKDSGQWHYSNDNYSLLAGIIEQVSGKGYSEFIRDTVLAPAGLSHTGFYDTFNSALFHANPYQKANTDPYQLASISDASLSQEFGAGNMYMTPGDLYKFNQALITGKLVSPESLAEIQTPGNSKNGYGFGMYMSNDTKYSHGVLGSYNVLVLTSLDAKDAVIIMANEKPEFDILKVAGSIYEAAKKMENS